MGLRSDMDQDQEKAAVNNSTSFSNRANINSAALQGTKHSFLANVQGNYH